MRMQRPRTALPSLRLLAVMMTVLAACCHADDAPAVQVVLKDHVEVAADEIRLSDIAAAGSTGIGAWESLIVAPSPLPQRQRVITAGEVETRLARAGLRENQFSVTGSPAVIVLRAGQIISAHRLETLLRTATGKPLEVVYAPPPIIVPEGPVTVETDARRVPTASSSDEDRALLPVKVLVHDKVVATLSVLVDLPPAAPPDLPLATPFTSNALSRSAATTMPQQPAPVVVHSQQPVLITARSGRVCVRSTGKAMSDGRIGDVIMVSVAWTPQPLKAVVVGAGEVTINLP